MDSGELTDGEKRYLETAVPPKDAWRYEASRIAAEMNTALDSPWQNRIQMPGTAANCTTLQSFFTSLGPILSDADVKAQVNDMVASGDLKKFGMDSTGFIIRVLKNFWHAVAQVNPRAYDEPQTTVLWAPIGSSACHIALAQILKTVLDSDEPNLETERLVQMMEGSSIGEYEYWYSRKGKNPNKEYPSEKGDAVVMTGAANYKRLAQDLEVAWRANLHAKPENRQIRI